MGLICTGNERRYSGDLLFIYQHSFLVSGVPDIALYIPKEAMDPLEKNGRRTTT